jgi:hypothetical protein
LLICLNNAEIASDLLMAAKQLRRSDDEKIRSINFNPDIASGEAQAAYERRQRGRQHQGQYRGQHRTEVKQAAAAAELTTNCRSTTN